MPRSTPADIFHQRQTSDEQGEQAGDPGPPRSPSGEQQKAGTTADEPESRVVLHGNERGQNLHERLIAHMPTDDDDAPQAEDGEPCHQADEPERLFQTAVGRSRFLHTISGTPGKRVDG